MNPRATDRGRRRLLCLAAACLCQAAMLPAHARRPARFVFSYRIESAQELDRPVEVRLWYKIPLHRYSAQIISHKFVGQVRAQVRLSDDGFPLKIRILEPRPENLLGKMVREELRKWRWTAPIAGGRPVETTIVMEFTFRERPASERY